MQSEQTINIDLKPMNEQAPHSAGPMGRLARIQNGVAKKFLGDSLRVSKRPGCQSLENTTYANGSATSAPANPKLLSSWNEQLFMVGGTTPYVFSDTRDRWERFTSVFSTSPSVATQTLTKRPLYNSSAKAYAPDVAAVGDVLCYIVTDSVLGALATFVDVDGTQIRAPFSLTGTQKAKVVSDGTVFLIYSQSASNDTTYVQAFNTDGSLLASTSYAWGAARPLWDVRQVSTLSLLVTSTGGNTTLRSAFYSAGVITSSGVLTFAVDSSLGLAHLENTFGGTNMYLAAVDAGAVVTPYEVSNSGVLLTTYAAATTASVNYVVANITGFTTNASFDLKLAISELKDNTATPSKAAIDNFTVIASQTHAGGASSVTKLGLAIVSRAYVDDIGVWRVVAYFQDTACYAINGSVRDTSLAGAMPTFFVIDMSALVAQVVGQFDTGFAYGFYATSRNSVVYTPWHLSSVAADSTTLQHIPLGYLGVQTLLPGSPGGVNFSAITGISDYRISKRTGKPLVTTDALMIPGLQADGYDGANVADWGLQVAPTIVNSIPSAGGSMTSSETVTYVAVFEWTDARGNLHQSALSEPVIQALGPGDTQVTLTVETLRFTLKTNVVVALYRTYSPVAGSTTPGVILRRVMSTANNVLANTVTFVDTVSDATAAGATACYSQPLNTSAPVALDYFPPPPFSKGITFDGRAFVIGYDGAVWFSFPKTEGQGLAFNGFYRIVLPTTAQPVDIAPLDGRLAITADDGTVWSVPSGGLPNATLSSGSIPTPEQVPATAGATSASLLTPLGVVYGAESGIWLMDRSLSMRFIGGPVVDEVTTSQTVIDIALDTNQRVYFALGTDGAPGTVLEVLVYDLVSNCWYVWLMPDFVVAMTAWKGHLAYVDTAAVVHVLDDDETTDYTDDGNAIPSIYELASVDFAGVNGYESCWQVQFYGSYEGPHTLTVDVKYDQSETVTETFVQDVPSDPGIYRYEVMPTQIDCQAIGLVFSDSFNVAVGNSFALEAIGILVGVESGLGRISPTTRRIAP